jgi:hypothetical protein
MDSFEAQKTDTLLDWSEGYIIHKWTYDDIDIEFEEMFYKDKKNKKSIKLDFKFQNDKEGSFINDYNDEVNIRLTNRDNKLCVYFRIDDIDYHNKPASWEFDKYVDDFKMTILGVYDYVYELNKFEKYYYDNIGEVIEERYMVDELEEITLDDEYYYDISDCED